MYKVTFTESGLPSGTHWSVRVMAHTAGWFGAWGWFFGGTHSSSGSSINFSLPNGSYSYRVAPLFGFVAAHPSGTFNVSGASPPTISIAFSARPTFAVTFQETGLTGGTTWAVTVLRVSEASFFLGGYRSTENSTGGSITFHLPNGTYFYHVAAIPGYSISNGRGLLNVTGAAPAPISITFTKLVTYAVTFNESGLPAGTNWTIWISAPGPVSAGSVPMHMTSSTSTISFQLTNGTYVYALQRIPGWYVSGGSPFGTITVNGASPAETSFVFHQWTAA